MNKQSMTASRLAFLLAIGSAGLTGCFSDSGNNSNNNSGVLRGRIQGDLNTSSSTWAGTVVTTHTLSTDGTLSAPVDSVTAESDGSFTIAGAGQKEWILRAHRGDTVWMARYAGTLTEGGTEKARPLNLQTSVEASVWMELKKTSDGREVSASEIDLAVNAAGAAMARSEYRSNATVSNALVARLATAVKAASRARHAYLTSGDSLYTSKRTSIDSARGAAEDTLTAALYAAAADTARIHAAERVFLTSTVNAYVRAGVHRVAYARSSEASYHAMLRNSSLLSDSTRTEMGRNYARVLGQAADTAMRNEFRVAGSSTARTSLVSAAGVTFQSSLETAVSRARIDTAVVRYRAEVKAAFNSASDTLFNTYKSVSSELGVVTLNDSLSVSLASQVGASATGEAVGTAYATAQIAAQSNLQTRIRAINNNDVMARAAAAVQAFLAVRAALN